MRRPMGARGSVRLLGVAGTRRHSVCSCRSAGTFVRTAVRHGGGSTEWSEETTVRLSLLTFIAGRPEGSRHSLHNMILGAASGGMMEAVWGDPNLSSPCLWRTRIGDS